MGMTLSENTLERLLMVAEEKFGFTSEDVRSLMKANNWPTFHSSNWSGYMAVMVGHYRCLQLLKDYPDCCPICSELVRRDPFMDGCFGVKLGWMCTKEHIHFLEARVKVVRDQFKKKEELSCAEAVL